MQISGKQIDRPIPDENLLPDCDVPEEIDFWGINEFADVLPADVSMAAEHY